MLGALQPAACSSSCTWASVPVASSACSSAQATWISPVEEGAGRARGGRHGMMTSVSVAATARRGQNVSWRDEANNRCARAAQCAWSVRLNSLGMGQDKSPEDAPSVPSSCAGLAGTWSFRRPRAATPPPTVTGGHWPSNTCHGHVDGCRLACLAHPISTHVTRCHFSRCWHQHWHTS